MSHKSSFASSKDYAIAVSIPFVLTVGFLMKHFFHAKQVVATTHTAWSDHAWAFDTSLLGHLFAFALLTTGLSSALFLLRGLDRLIAAEEKQNQQNSLNLKKTG